MAHIDLKELEESIRKIERSSSSLVSQGRSKSITSTKSDDSAYSKLLNLLSFKDYTEKLAYEKLQKYEFEDAVIEEAVARAVSYGYINDERYARAYIFSKYNQNQGLIRIKRDLISAGIDEAVIDALYEECCEESGVSEYDRAMEYLERHPVTAKNIRDGAYRKLTSKGFNVDTASRAAKAYYQQHSR